MSKQTQRRIIEINHALSGVHGTELRQKAMRISDVRKEILRRLERKKKHSAILHDELYQYLQKFPEEVYNEQCQKNNLQKEVLKTKKNNFFEVEEKQVYVAPVLQYTSQEDSLIREERKEFQQLSSFLRSASNPELEELMS